MVHENEIIMIVLGLATLIFLLFNYNTLKQIPYFKLLFISYGLSTAGWLLTVLEGFFWEDYLNALEHVCYALSMIFLALWCWLIPDKKREKT
ncbi:MAG TPA: hypothetical protein PKJ10_06235 [Smithella sp.]|nr:hypothetical protein [Smithella sp.]